MVASFNYAPDKRIPLSEAEYNLLADMLSKGDRAGFYALVTDTAGNAELAAFAESNIDRELRRRK